MEKQNENEGYHTIIYNQIGVLHEISRGLNQLANAFHRTGNKEPAEELSLISDDIAEACRKIGHSVRDESNRQWKKSQETSRVILESALAGMRIAKEEK